MSARPDTWMPIYWGDYARDTGNLNNASHGAYLMLIKHYWCTGSPLTDDDDELWRIACCDSKKDWLKLRPKVVKLFRIVDGFLTHKRVDREIAKAVSGIDAKVEAGRRGAEKRWKNNGPAIADPLPEDSPPIADPSFRDRQTDATSPSPSPKKESGSLRSPVQRIRGVRLPDDWSPGDEGRTFAVSLGLDPQRVFEEFRDHWRGVSGAAGVKLDWSATFRNRCRWLADHAKSPTRMNGGRQTAAAGWADRYGIGDEAPSQFDLEGIAE